MRENNLFQVAQVARFLGDRRRLALASGAGSHRFDRSQGRVQVSNRVIGVEVQDASISTVSVTLKAIQVGKKQMTKAVFRQLPTCTLVNGTTMEVDGDIWGWVNDSIPDQSPGRNFIVQRGGRLYRSTYAIYQSSQFDEYFGPPWHINAARKVKWLMRRRFLAAAIEHGIEKFLHPSCSALPAGLDPARRPGGLLYTHDGYTFSSSPKLHLKLDANPIGCIREIVDDTIPHIGDIAEGSGGSNFLNRSSPESWFRWVYLPDCDSIISSNLASAERALKDSESTEDYYQTYQSRYLKRQVRDLEVLRAQSTDCFLEYLGAIPGDASIPTEVEVVGELKAGISAWRQDCARWDVVMDRISTIEQLYIAV